MEKQLSVKKTKELLKVSKVKRGVPKDKALEKAGGMIGELKRRMKDKTDHYQDFKKQHKIK